MNNLYTDIGYRSLKKDGEQLCGDCVTLVSPDETSQIVVLADGLGSGVKASILATLTAQILSTMLASGLSIEDSVATVAATLPVCSVRGLAYSTFTILEIRNNEEMHIIEYDNPRVMLFRQEKFLEIPTTMVNIDGKDIYHSHLHLEEGDTFLAVSDGVLHAGVGMRLNFGWQREDVIQFMQLFCGQNFTASTLSTILLEECNKLYGGTPGDDATVCTVRIRRRVPYTVLVGPPSNADDDRRMLSLFFSKAGKHVVCGGTTSKIVARYLGKPLVPELESSDPEVPPIATLEGVDLVTEGILTLSKVLVYAESYLADNHEYTQWSYQKDGASQLARMLFEDATDINFFVGRAVNPAHQNPTLPIDFNLKMGLVNQLVDSLERMGKQVNVSYF